MNSDSQKSAQSCGCDEGANHLCERHTKDLQNMFGADAPYAFAFTNTAVSAGTCDAPTTIASGSVDWRPLQGIKDSGQRVTFASGSMRDPSTGKIKWSRITFGPMMRRWAQHLTTAEAKYPDPTPGFPNFMLIETDEEFIRYKESAFRHFLSWFHGETDEDHAAATFFNINGVELIKDKWRKNGTHAELLGPQDSSKEKGA